VALIVVDSSVVIAQLDAADSLHAQASAALLAHATDDLHLPASAYAESLIGLARAGRLAEARAAIGALGLAIAPIDEAVAEEAAMIRAREQALRLPDALVLACGEVLDADIVLTGDRRWQQFPRVELIA
jgi:predicted nucleic acid-binding protein